MTLQRRRAGPSVRRRLLVTVAILVLLATGGVYVLLQSHWDIRISICTSAPPARTDRGCNGTPTAHRDEHGAASRFNDIVLGTGDTFTFPSSRKNRVRDITGNNVEVGPHVLVNESATHMVKFGGQECERKLPSCIIIGIQKCGTTALSEFLRTHPDIAIESRQIYYFSQHYDRGIDWYRRQMPCSHAGQVTIERTPQYFYMHDVPERIQQLNKGMLLIIIVRDPVKRTISNFAMSQYRLREQRSNSFESCVLENNNSTVSVNSSSKYIRKSTYHTFTSRWLRYFPLDQILVLDGERFIDDPVSQLGKVENFLGVKHHISHQHFTVNGQSGFQCVRGAGADSPLRCLPKSKGRMHPYVNDNIINVLRDYFRPHNELFFDMVKERFDW